jgi:chromosome partitioning protein
MPTRVICIANQKGGVAKTAVSVNLATALAMSGHSTLLIDTDPQGGASDSLGYLPHKDSTLTLAHWYRNPEPLQASKHIFETQSPNLFLLPNTLDSMEAAIAVARSPTPSTFVQRFLKCPAVKDRFSFVVIDTPPNLDVHFNNGVMASDFVIIPMTPELKAVRGIMNLQDALEKLAQASSIRILGVLLTKVQANLNTHKRVTEFLRSTYGDLVFDNQLLLSKDFPETDEYGKLSVLMHAPASKSASSILALCEEILGRMSEVGSGRRTKPKLWDGKIARAYEALVETM